MFRNRKLDHFKSVLHRFLASYNDFSSFYITLNFRHFSILKNRFLPLWHAKYESGYHFGYHTICFPKAYLSNSLRPHLPQLIRIIAFCILIFVTFPQILYFPLYYVLTRSSSRGVPMKKFLQNQKVWNLIFLTPCRTYL